MITWTAKIFRTKDLLHQHISKKLINGWCNVYMTVHNRSGNTCTKSQHVHLYIQHAMPDLRADMNF